MSKGTTDFFVQWHLTERCNLACRHCYQEGPTGEELSPAEVRTAAAEAADMIEAWERSYGITFSRWVQLSGGEPLLRADLFATIRLLRDLGFAVDLLTNGTLIRRETARELRSSGIRSVQVSIEGPREVNDLIRGAGAYDAALEGVRALTAEGLRVTLNATLSRTTADYLHLMPALAAALHVPRVGFARHVPAGRGAKMTGKMLSPQELKALYESLFAASQPGVEWVCGDPLANQLCAAPSADGSVAAGGCAIGVSGITLLADGTVVPCRRMPVVLGNIRSDSLREIWATSEVLQKLRTKEEYEGTCGTCARWTGCRGCRAVAYAATGSVTGADPQCFFHS